jgi:hypothetical protein
MARKKIPPAKPPARVEHEPVGTPEPFPTRIVLRAILKDKPFFSGTCKAGHEQAVMLTSMLPYPTDNRDAYVGRMGS